jgi:hypothetical protein
MNAIQLLQITPEELTNLIKEGLKPELDLLIQNYKNKPQEHKEFITRKETAKFFEISLVCLHDWSKKGIVKPYKMGNRTYFRYSELVETLTSSNKKGQSKR